MFRIIVAICLGIALAACVADARRHRHFPLHDAVYVGYNRVLEVVHANQNIDIDLKNEYGQTPLAIAVSNNFRDIIEYLLDRGANPNIIDNEGYSPFMRAIQKGDQSLMALIIENINVNIENVDIDSWGSVLGCMDTGIIRNALARKGVNFNANQNKWENRLEAAISRGETSDIIFTNFVMKNCMDSAPPMEWALLLAAEKGHKKIVEILIDHGVDINAKDGVGKTAVSLAALRGHENTTRLLVEKGANVRIKDNAGLTALHQAAFYDHVNVVKILVNSAADINAMDNLGWTPLHWAASGGHEDIVRVLIEKYAFSEPRNFADETPCDVALKADPINSEVVKILQC